MTTPVRNPALFTDEQLTEIAATAEGFVDALKTEIDCGHRERAHQLILMSFQAFADGTKPSLMSLTCAWYLKKWHRCRDERTAEIFLCASHAATGLRDYKLADRFLTRVISLSKARWPELQRRALQSLGVLRHNQRRFDERDDLYERALTIAKELGDDFGIAQLYNNIGASCTDSDPKRAERLLKKSIQIKRRYGWDVDALRTEIAFIGVLGRLGRYEEALSLLESTIPAARDLHDGTLLTLAHHNRGILLSDSGRLTEAMPELKKAVSLARRTEDPHLVQNSLQALAVVCHRAGKNALAAEYFRELAALCERLGDRFGQAMAHHDLGACLLNLKRFEAAKAEYTDAGKCFDAISETLWNARCQLYVAKLTEGFGGKNAVARLLSVTESLKGSDFPFSDLTDMALMLRDDRIFQDALSIERKKRPRSSASWGFRLSMLGATQIQHRQWASAQTLLTEAFRILTAAKEREAAGSAGNDAGISFLERGDFSNALKYFNKALSIGRRAENRAINSQSAHNIGELHRRLGHSRLANKYFNESIALAEAVGDIESVAGSLHCVGLLRLSEERLVDATRAFEQTKRIADKLDDDLHRAQASMGLGSVAYRQGRYRDAHVLYQQAAKLFKLSDKQHEYLNATYESALVLDKMGKPQRAFNLLSKCSKLASDSGDFGMLAIICQGASYITADNGTILQTAKMIAHSIVASLAADDRSAFPRVIESYMDCLLKLGARMTVSRHRFAALVLKNVHLPQKDLMVLLGKRLKEANSLVELPQRPREATG